MHEYQSTVLTAYDYTRLRALMAKLIGCGSPLAAIVRRKLGTARVVPLEEVPEDLVTSGLRVRYETDGGGSEDRALVWDADEHFAGPALSLLRPRGLALLGLNVGQAFSYRDRIRKTRTVLVKHILADRRPNFVVNRGLLDERAGSVFPAPARVRLPTALRGNERTAFIRGEAAMRMAQARGANGTAWQGWSSASPRSP